MIEQYALSLRESSRFIQFVNLAVHEPTHESHKYDFSFPDGKAKLFGLMYVVPLLVVLKMTNNESYNQFVEGKNATPLVNLLSKCVMTGLIVNSFHEMNITTQISCRVRERNV